MNRLHVAVLIGLGIVRLGSVEAEVISPMNGRSLRAPDAGSSYTFLLVGHAYGAPQNKFSVYPAASLLANPDIINDSDALFLALLGDNYRSAEEVQVNNFRKIVAAINIPVFNAPGNHDLANRDIYTRTFGQTYYDFRVGHDLFVVLDTELSPGEIAGEQLQYFTELMGAAAANGAIRNVFVLSHELLWCVDEPRLGIVFEHLNSRDQYRPDSFKASLEPLVFAVAAEKPIFWLSGDIGCSWSLSLFYWEDPERDVTYLATGLGDTARDAIIEVEVGRSGDVTFTPLSLTGETLEAIDHYGPDYWTSHFEQITDIKGINKSARVRDVLSAKTFWAGVISAAILAVFIQGIVWWRRRWTSRQV